MNLQRTKHNTLDAGEINDFFAGDSLSPEQMDHIYSYLENRNIDVSSRNWTNRCWLRNPRSCDDHGSGSGP